VQCGLIFLRDIRFRETNIRNENTGCQVIVRGKEKGNEKMNERKMQSKTSTREVGGREKQYF